MGNTVEYVITADESRGVEAFRRLKVAMKEAETAGDKFNKETYKNGDSIEKLSGGIAGFKNQLLGLTAGYATIQGLTTLVDSYYQTVERGAQKQAQIGQGMKGLAAATPGGATEIDAKLKEVSDRGLKMGVKPDDMAQIDSWANNVAQRFGDTVVKDLGSREVTLEKINFDPEATRDAMASLVQQGVDPAEASRLMVGAFQNTHLKDSSMAKIPASIEKFSSAREGLTVAAGMAQTGIFTPKELPGKIGEVGEAFAEGSRIDKFLRKKYESVGANYEGISTETKLANLEQLGYSDEKKLGKKFKLSESQSSTISELIGRRDVIASTRQTIDSTGANAAEAKLAEMKKVPALNESFARQDQEALASYTALYGPQAEGERQTSDIRRKMGAGFMKSKQPWAKYMYDKDSGMASEWAAAPVEATLWAEKQVSGAAGKVSADIAAKSGTEGGGAEQNTTSLDKNTEATNQLTEALKSAAVGTNGGAEPSAPSIGERARAGR